MTSDDSIWGVPCPSDLKRNKNILIIGAQVNPAELSRDLGLGAFHPPTILSQLRKYCVILL